MRLGHVAFYARDLEKMLDFYCRGLGFPKLFVMRNGEGEISTVYVKIAEREFIEFFTTKDELKPNGSYSHLCLHTEDIERELAELAARGILPFKPLATGKSGSLMAWIKDPEGNAIELMQLLPGSMQLK